MAAGIVSFGTYVPNYRLPREVMAKEWGISSLGGERTVANFDEDSLTLAVNAAVDAFAGGNGTEATRSRKQRAGFHTVDALEVGERQGLLFSVDVEDLASDHADGPAR